MQQLHLVGFTTDVDGLIFSARRGSKSGGYVVTLDARLISVIRDAVRMQGGDLGELDEEADDPAATGGRHARGRRPTGPTSALSPKDIQARLRAGRTIADVADEAGVDEHWIGRFAAPVLAEQTRIIERAVVTHCRTTRKGISGEPLGNAVAWAMVERGLRLTAGELNAGWGAYHVRDASWVVGFRYLSRGREQLAQWEFDAATGDLVALNRLGSDLGYVEPGTRRRLPSTLDAIAAEDVGPRVAGAGGVEDSAAAPRRSARAATRVGSSTKRAGGANARRTSEPRSPSRATAGSGARKSGAPKGRGAAKRPGGGRGGAAKAKALPAAPRKKAGAGAKAGARSRASAGSRSTGRVKAPPPARSTAARGKAPAARSTTARSTTARSTTARSTTARSTTARSTGVRLTGAARSTTARVKPPGAPAKAPARPQPRAAGSDAKAVPPPQLVPPPVTGRIVRRPPAHPVEPVAAPAARAPRPLRVRPAPAVSHDHHAPDASVIADSAWQAAPLESDATVVTNGRPARQRPLVAVRKIDSRARPFGPAKGGRVVEPADPPAPATRVVRAEPSRPDAGQSPVIQARQAGQATSPS